MLHRLRIVIYYNCSATCPRNFQVERKHLQMAATDLFIACFEQRYGVQCCWVGCRMHIWNQLSTKHCLQPQNKKPKKSLQLYNSYYECSWRALRRLQHTNCYTFVLKLEKCPLHGTVQWEPFHHRFSHAATTWSIIYARCLEAVLQLHTARVRCGDIQNYGECDAYQLP